VHYDDDGAIEMKHLLSALIYTVHSVGSSELFTHAENIAYVL